MARSEIAELEEHRLTLQGQLDSKKNQTERNQMGQFATPSELAVDILRYAEAQIGDDERVRFLDPSLGTGSFYSALLKVFPQRRIAAAVGYEIDPHYGVPATDLWEKTGLDLRLCDFTQAEVPSDFEKFNLLICNPPYVRHHHIDGREKQRLKACLQKACNMRLSGLAGLYCYFLGISHKWLAKGGLAGWLVPSEFMDVNYGAAVRHYLLNDVTLLHLHRFDPEDAQFEDALVSSAVVWFRKAKPPLEHQVRFTYGGSLDCPRLERLVPAKTLCRNPKWTGYPVREEADRANVPVLGDLFSIKRGLVTGGNRYFILTLEEIERRGLPREAFRPILPSPRYLQENEVAADGDGNPLLGHRLFLLDCRLEEVQIRKEYPALWKYLEEGEALGVAKRYLCRHRTPWYIQEERPPAPFVCTYLGRRDTKSGRPFRFILNHSRATAANVYLMLYPKGPIARALEEDPDLKKRLWRFLNEIRPQTMLDEGRVYGGGLHKLEPRELGNVPVAEFAELLPELARLQSEKQGELFAAV